MVAQVWCQGQSRARWAYTRGQHPKECQSRVRLEGLHVGGGVAAEMGDGRWEMGEAEQRRWEMVTQEKSDQVNKYVLEQEPGFSVFNVERKKTTMNPSVN